MVAVTLIVTPSYGRASSLSLGAFDPVLIAGPRSEDTLERISRSNTLWYQFQLGGSIYDARRESIVARWSPGVQVGRRYVRYGYFLNVEMDQTFDLTQEVRKIDVFHIGVGVDLIQFLGHVRSSVSVGIAILKTHTDIDSKGKTGWYVDLRPSALRWSWGPRAVIEFTPLSLDVSVPVTKGIPLVLFSYFTLVSLEWVEEVGLGETNQSVQ